MPFGSTTIAAIYKDRWQIEIFFKTIKQNLRIKTFVGTSSNALHPDLDSIDRGLDPEVPQVSIPVPMVPVEPGGDAAVQPVHLQGLMGMDRSAL
jgi:hypothetical protein